jgi:hypothetical protein
VYIHKFVGENSWITICQPKLAQWNKLVGGNMLQSINKDTNPKRKWKYKEKDLSSCWINISPMLIIKERWRSNTLKSLPTTCNKATMGKKDGSRSGELRRSYGMISYVPTWNSTSSVQWSIILLGNNGFQGGLFHNIIYSLANDSNLYFNHWFIKTNTTS